MRNWFWHGHHKRTSRGVVLLTCARVHVSMNRQPRHQLNSIYIYIYIYILNIYYFISVFLTYLYRCYDSHSSLFWLTLSLFSSDWLSLSSIHIYIYIYIYSYSVEYLQEIESRENQKRRQKQYVNSAPLNTPPSQQLHLRLGTSICENPSNSSTTKLNKLSSLG